MHFTPVQNAESPYNFPLLHLMSTDGRWELGYYPVMFGVRVRLGKVGGQPVVDLCCGAAVGLRTKVLAYVRWKLAAVGEISEHEMTRMFPWPKIKPLNLDPWWVARLEEFDKVFAAA